MAADGALLLVSFTGYGLAGRTAGQGALLARETLTDPALRRSLRDHRGELFDPGFLSRAYSGVATPFNLRDIPGFLERVRAGRAWHRAQQETLDALGGSSEPAVLRPRDLERGIASGKYHWVDHYAHQWDDPEILSMKHTQLASLRSRAAYAYLSELATKYRPGIPIGNVASTPTELLSKELVRRVVSS